MNNRTLGKIGAVTTGVAVLAFAISMIFGLFTDTLFYSCLCSMFIALGFVPFMCALNCMDDKKEQSGCRIAAVCFAVVYITLIFIVYYAQCTTLHMNNKLSEEMLSIISFQHLGSLFFNYDLLGYGFMALSTFLTGIGLKTVSFENKCLKGLLMIHGTFFFLCLIIPMFPVFNENTGNAAGTIMLEAWCIYFIPVCILGYRYFSKQKDTLE